MALSVMALKHAQPRDKDWKLADEKGLYVLIRPNGSKHFKFKFRLHGKEKKLSLGAFPEVSLQQARNDRDEARALIAKGQDPALKKRAKKLSGLIASENTFVSIAREFIAKREQEGIRQTTKAKHDWLLSLLEPDIGKIPVSDLSAPLLLAVLRRTQDKGNLETARRLRAFASRVIDYAVATGRAPHNPATSLRRALVTPQVKNHPAIVDAAAFGELLSKIDTFSGYPSTMAALRLAPHVFQRPGELRTMCWNELDLAKAVWQIPASKMKMKRDHAVPLSRQAVAIIRAQQIVSGHSAFVFPAFHTPKIPLSENTLNQALRRLGYKGIMTAHGFRSAASSLLNECDKWSPDAIERALAHQDTNRVRANYNRSAYWSERVRMAQWWSDYLDELKHAHRQRGPGPEKAPSEAPKSRGLLRASATGHE